jgi:hypothetical protein
MPGHFEGRVWELIVQGSSCVDFESQLSQTRSTGARGDDAEGSSRCQTSMLGSSIALVLSRSDSLANSSGSDEYLGRIKSLRHLGHESECLEWKGFGDWKVQVKGEGTSMISGETAVVTREGAVGAHGTGC